MKIESVRYLSEECFDFFRSKEVIEELQWNDKSAQPLSATEALKIGDLSFIFLPIKYYYYYLILIGTLIFSAFSLLVVVKMSLL